MKEKVYQVTVVLEVYGQASKTAAAEFLEDALHVDGMFVHSQTVPKIVERAEVLQAN